MAVHNHSSTPPPHGGKDEKREDSSPPRLRREGTQRSGRSPREKELHEERGAQRGKTRTQHPRNARGEETPPHTPYQREESLSSKNRSAAGDENTNPDQRSVNRGEGSAQEQEKRKERRKERDEEEVGEDRGKKKRERGKEGEETRGEEEEGKREKEGEEETEGFNAEKHLEEGRAAEAQPHESSLTTRLTPSPTPSPPDQPPLTPLGRDARASPPSSPTHPPLPPRHGGEHLQEGEHIETSGEALQDRETRETLEDTLLTHPARDEAPRVYHPSLTPPRMPGVYETRLPGVAYARIEDVYEALRTAARRLDEDAYALDTYAVARAAMLLAAKRASEWREEQLFWKSLGLLERILQRLPEGLREEPLLPPPVYSALRDELEYYLERHRKK